MYKKGQRIRVPVGDDVVTFVVCDVYEAETYITVCFALDKINDIGLNDGLTMQCFSIRIDKERMVNFNDKQ